MFSYDQQQHDVYVQFMEGNIESFYKVAYAPLIIFAERLLGAEMAYMAEDCVQDAVFEVYAKREKMTSPAHLRQFLYRCVHNNAISFLRKNQSRDRYLSSDGCESEEDHSLELIRQETFERLAFALKQLPPELQEMARLVFNEGLTGKEIAKRLGISLSGVKKRKLRLLERLRHLITDDNLMVLIGILLS